MDTILLVEDDKNQILLYEQELAIEGYKVVTATNGIEAIENARHFKPDLVVMDINMPMMDGIESMCRILSEHKNIPIIINTAYSNYQNNFMSWSADAYIVKSSDLKELKDKIKELLNKRKKNDNDKTV
ncbi:MAG: response regulator [Candidatus Kuenenia stuttgartiensis]|jgi:CheY-like chemotaxis protein|uniref:Similar to two component response regulator n=1 Tax=Kuenenia stuttgartiensis TaxID=174633 RepID=Q1Q6L0_KUEST|nr:MULTISPECIES: response regulator [Kuenenia]MBE7548433.1 response regulator [Planctomycetia bacterium]MBZ0191370.1 response regulator [Candidatus Kuenenia stuttgartiensis]MCF6151642.1 response regulator [Candidatus Kuenenia stuttgartiensis]MCL4726626.1 response regulator [Candidatus Kuenenia stuttgartiensis]MCZ7620909.1 response regulator [Candidatus Kuenenia sp.]